MNPATDVPAQSIVVEYELSHAPQKVWRALTDSKLLSAWLMENDLRAEVGHRFTFRAQPMPGWDGIVHCEVLEAEPHQRLRYSWRGGVNEAEGYGGRLDTVVSWTLTPTQSGGTLLRLEHSGFLPKNAFAFETMGKGWRGHVAQRMQQVLAEL